MMSCLVVMVMLISGVMVTGEVDVMVRNVANANADFALRMLRRQAMESQDNIFFAPYSISTALAMTFLGAKTQTATEMSEVLGFLDIENNVHQYYSDLDKLIQEEADNYTLDTANRLFAEQEGIEFEPKYLNDVRKYYGAPVEQLDFMHKPEPSRLHINKWVAKQTDDLIKDLLSPGLITKDTLLVLVNAIMFKGLWDVQFKKEDTKKGIFNLTNEDTVDADMMTVLDEFKYMESNDGFRILELPYQGKQVSMYVLLPNSIKGLDNVVASLSIHSLNTIWPNMQRMKVRVKLPKFSISYNLKLKPMLRAMGMNEAFSNSADFSGMITNTNVKISEVVHQAFVDVNEEGTKAAGATAVVIAKMSVQRHPEFIVDRPFLFLIRERSTGTILFLGRVMNPTTTYMGKRSAPLTANHAAGQSQYSFLTIGLLTYLCISLSKYP